MAHRRRRTQFRCALVELFCLRCSCFSGSGATEPRVAIPSMSLNCWVRGQGLNTVFRVEISSMALVETLKKIIKNENPASFRDIDADTLSLYKVTIPFDDRVEETVQGLILCQEDLLQPLETPSHYFPEAPLDEHIHLVVVAPCASHSVPLLFFAVDHSCFG